MSEILAQARVDRAEVTVERDDDGKFYFRVYDVNKKQWLRQMELEKEQIQGAVDAMMLFYIAAHLFKSTHPDIEMKPFDNLN